uniref:Uncharacterized protein n=1 Tax=Knipowitschia caucasica TaxID=637954 RepID=A0AAV2LGS6_KNICA
MADFSLGSGPVPVPAASVRHDLWWRRTVPATVPLASIHLERCSPLGATCAPVTKGHGAQRPHYCAHGGTQLLRCPHPTRSQDRPCPTLQHLAPAPRSSTALLGGESCTEVVSGQTEPKLKQVSAT